MATTEALNTQEDNDEPGNVETELEDVQHKVQQRKKYIYRCVAISLIVAIIVAVSIIVLVLNYKIGVSGQNTNSYNNDDASQGIIINNDGEQVVENVDFTTTNDLQNGGEPTESSNQNTEAAVEPVYGDESIMSQKEHGTCIDTVQDPLRWDCSTERADNICCYNRHYAEYSGYWQSTTFLKQVDKNNITIFYDSVTGKPLFKAPIGRTFEQFETESNHHGWPSFRDEEVVWDNVRILSDGECVSVDGTHLGHNIPDYKGNRYCINIVSVAGYPKQT